MRKIVLLVLLFAGTVCGQAKVGTTGANYLNIETSVTATGMGLMRLVVPQDCNFATNPALLPFSHHSRLRLGGNPWTNEYQSLIKMRTGYASVAIPLGNTSPSDTVRDTTWRVAAAYRYVGSSLDPMYERTYGNGDFDGTGATFEPKMTVHQFAVGMAYTGTIDFGIGAAVKFGHESFSGYTINSTSYDVGAYGRVPIFGDRKWDENASATQLRLLAGFAVTNFGPKITVLDHQYGQPRMTRFALGAEAHAAKCRLLLGLQQDHSTFDEVDGTHLGGEVEWHRAITLRAGQSWYATTSIDVASIGGSISLRGLLAVTSNGRTNLGFDVKAHYAHTLSEDSGIFGDLNTFSLQFEI